MTLLLFWASTLGEREEGNDEGRAQREEMAERQNNVNSSLA